MNHAIHIILLERRANGVEIADVSLHKAVIRRILNVFQVSEIAGIGEGVQIDDAVFRVFIHEKAHHMRADEPGTASNENGTRESHHIRKPLRAVTFTENESFCQEYKLPACY